MTVSGTDGKERRVLLRIPGYVTGAALTLNGNVIRPAVEKGYACVRRAFAEGDELEITFEMKSTFMRANDEVRADAGRVALVRGPLVYCLEQADNGENLGQLVVDAQSPIEEIYDEDLLGGTMLLRCRGWRTGRGAGGDELYSSAPAKAAGKVLTFVPYPYWGNRGEGEMIVWVREALKF